MKLKKLLALATAMLLMLCVFCACNDAPENIAADLKLVSTAADISEILDGLGLGKSIIAADLYSFGIGDVSPDVCTLDYMNPDVEFIVSLSPDVVFVSGSSTEGTVDPYSTLSGMGVNVVYIPTAESIQGIRDNINTIAKNVSAEAKASKLIKRIDDAVDAAKKLADGKEPVSVYFEISSAPWLYSFGSGTYLDEIITICGGKNIYTENGWLSNSEESVLSANPDVIITNVMYDGYDYNEISARPGWDSVSAVKNGRVYQIDANSSSRGSQNIANAIEAISNAICNAK